MVSRNSSEYLVPNRCCFPFAIPDETDAFWRELGILNVVKPVGDGWDGGGGLAVSVIAPSNVHNQTCCVKA